jgi:hypothetical protein
MWQGTRLLSDEGFEGRISGAISGCQAGNRSIHKGLAESEHRKYEFGMIEF